MQTFKFSYLNWDSIDKIPIPKAIKESNKDLDWAKQRWFCFGLPIPDAQYDIVNGVSLYFQSFPDGTAKVEKLDLTTRINFFTIIFGKEIHDLISFEADILKGEVIDVKLLDYVQQTDEDLAAYMPEPETFETGFFSKYIKKPYRVSVFFVFSIIFKVIDTVTKFLYSFLKKII